jgi:hypothetical protein
VIFYAPDLIFIHERSAALKDMQIYIGDAPQSRSHSFANAEKR